MKIKELVEKLFQIKDQNRQVYVLDNNSGYHLKINDLELTDEDDALIITE